MPWKCLWDIYGHQNERKNEKKNHYTYYILTHNGVQMCDTSSCTADDEIEYENTLQKQ